MNFFNFSGQAIHFASVIAMDLQPPSVLAQLPRPLHASTGSTHIGEVYSLTESKKRKRYEAVVAVDGEAVNIYNV